MATDKFLIQGAANAPLPPPFKKKKLLRTKDAAPPKVRSAIQKLI